MKTTTALHLMLLLASIISLTGCAVLTVDVDVYKGPLANHKDVQVEQMAAMAIGAKPLLVELRDTLEGLEGYEIKDHNTRTILRGAAGFRKWASDRCWYKSTYIWPVPAGTKSRFKNQNADRVNDILYLYEDRRDDQFSRFMDRAQQAARDYKNAYRVFRPQSLRKDQLLWQKLELKLKDSHPNVSKLWESYEKFCTRSKRDAKQLFKDWKGIRGKFSDKNAVELQNHPLLKNRDDELEACGNAQFRALAETSLVDYHADNIFGLKGRDKDLFVNHVKGISRAFLDSRDALERLWRTMMEAIILMESEPTSHPDDRKLHIEEFASFSNEIIQPRSVAILMELEKHIKQEMPREVEDLHELLPKLTVSELAKPRQGWHWDGSAYKKAKDLLLTAFREEPVKTAKGLLASHQFCKLRLDPKDLRNKIEIEARHLRYISGWDFGLVRAPFEGGATKELEPKQVQQKTDEVFGGGAFGKGRLDDGLETLIEKYLKTAEVCGPNDTELRWACKRLSDALVRFAEKVLFVANNNSLISPPKEAGLVPGVIDISIRALLGDKVRDDLCKSLNWKIPGDTAGYTRVLQAVGNSILVQVDALRQERKHQERLKDHYKKEAAILANTLGKMPPVHHNTIGNKSVDSMLYHESRTARDVRDVWIELLEYEHDLALYYGEAQRAKEINDALEAARKKREGMIFIRPAMAYLRTSFPATSLQDNPNLTWDNMLGGHMMRSIPFGPQLHDLLNPNAKRDARINAEIDKQFWQNINRVRVAGGGKTNYVIAKDDIGNWYVKGYSADPKDIIKSAKNLAMFSLSAKMSTLPGQLDLNKNKKEAKQKTDAEKSSLGQMFNKYQKDYNDRTKNDYDRLCEILREHTIESRIKKTWDDNEALKDYIKPLKDELAEASSDYLEPTSKELLKSTEEKEKETEKREKEEAGRGMKIVGTIQKIRLFYNALVNKIFVCLTNGPAKELEKAKIAKNNAKEEDKAEADYNVEAKQKEFNKAKHAAHMAQREVTPIVREELMEIITSRKDAVKDYETAIMFIGTTAKK